MKEETTEEYNDINIEDYIERINRIEEGEIINVVVDIDDE